MILLDMDGVVADFFNTALRWHGGLPFKSTWPRNQRDMWTPLGITEAEFYEPMKTREFWDDVRPYPGAPQFVNALREMSPVQIYTVTTGDHSVCGAAKQDWCQYWLGIDPRYVRAFRDSRAKAEVAARGPDRILIDDNAETCNIVRRLGGRAFLVRRPWNTEDRDVGFDKVDYQEILGRLR